MEYFSAGTLQYTRLLTHTNYTGPNDLQIRGYPYSQDKHAFLSTFSMKVRNNFVYTTFKSKTGRRDEHNFYNVGVVIFIPNL